MFLYLHFAWQIIIVAYVQAMLQVLSSSALEECVFMETTQNNIHAFFHFSLASIENIKANLPLDAVLSTFEHATTHVSLKHRVACTMKYVYCYSIRREENSIWK